LSSPLHKHRDRLAAQIRKTANPSWTMLEQLRQAEAQVAVLESDPGYTPELPKHLRAPAPGEFCHNHPSINMRKYGRCPLCNLLAGQREWERRVRNPDFIDVWSR